MMINLSVFASKVEWEEVYGPSRRVGRSERAKRYLVRPFALRMKSVTPAVLVLGVEDVNEEEEAARLISAAGVVDVSAADFSMSSMLTTGEIFWPEWC